jgi:hypothetical protein
VHSGRKDENGRQPTRIVDRFPGQPRDDMDEGIDEDHAVQRKSYERMPPAKHGCHGPTNPNIGTSTATKNSGGTGQSG